MGLPLRAGVWIALACACSARPGGDELPASEQGGAGLGGSASATGSAGVAGGGPVGSAAPGAASPGEPSELPLPPRELLEVDSGYPLAVPTAGACPAGTAPSERFTCTDVPYCFCEYVCNPACGAGEVCSPASEPGGAATCGCHPALEASEGGCVWRGLLADGSFDDPAAWRLYARSASENASAEVANGRLELSVTQRCGYAWGGAAARLPASTQLPEGAALVFDYRATGDASDREASVLVRLGGTGAVEPLDLSGSPAVMRSCAVLSEFPKLDLLEFYIETYGACTDPVDFALSIDNVRLEADPRCAPRTR